MPRRREIRPVAEPTSTLKSALRNAARASLPSTCLLCTVGAAGRSEVSCGGGTAILPVGTYTTIAPRSR